MENISLQEISQPPLRGFHVFGVELDTNESPAQNLGSEQRASGACEGIFCGVVRYVASAQIAAGMPPYVPVGHHITKSSSKRLQECHQSGVGAPRLLRLAIFDFAEGQCLRLHLQINFRIDIGRSQ